MKHYYKNQGVFIQANFIGQSVKLVYCASSGYKFDQKVVTRQGWRVLRKQLKPVNRRQRLFLDVVLDVYNAMTLPQTSRRLVGVL